MSNAVSHNPDHLSETNVEKTSTEAADIAAKSAALRTAYDAIKEATARFLKLLPNDSPVRDVMNEWDDAAKACFKELEELTQRIAKDWKKPCAAKLSAQKKSWANSTRSQRPVVISSRRRI